MADNVKQLTLKVMTQHEAAVKGLAYIGGGLQQLSQKAKDAQSSLQNVKAFATLKKDTVAAEAAWKSASNEVSRLAQELRQSKTSLAAMESGFQTAKKGADQAANSYQQNREALDQLRQKTDLSRNAWKSAAAEVKVLAKSLKETANPTREQEEQFAAAAKAADVLKQEYEQNQAASANLRKETQASKSAWDEAKNGVSALGKELKQSQSTVNKQSVEFKQAQRAAAGLKTEYQDNAKGLNALRKTLQQSGVDTSQLVAEQNKLKSSFQKLRSESVSLSKINLARGMLDVRPHREVYQEIKKLNAAYARLKVAHARGAISSKELYNAQLQLHRKTTELKASTNGWSESITKARGGLIALATAGYTVMKSVNGYASFEQRMAEVGTLTDASAERMQALGNEISQLSTDIPQTADSLAAAEYDILSAGVALEDSTKALELSGKAAVAGVTDTKTAVNAGLGVVNAYGLQIGELGSVYDVLFQTVKRGVTTFPELSQSIGDTLPTAKAADVGYRDVGAAIAALTQAGIKTPQAATALMGAINAMAAPAPEAKKKFEELGITWDGLIPTLEQIAQKNLTIDQMRLLIPDVRARTGVLALTQNLAKLKDSSAAMVESAGSMNTAFEKMKDTPENQLIKLQNALTALGQEFGEFISHVLLPGAEALTDVLKVINALPAPIRNFGFILTTAGAGLVAWKVGIRDIVLGLKGMRVHMLSTGAASAQMSNTVAASSGKMTTSLKAVASAANLMSVVGIAAYGTLAVYAYKAWQSYKDMREAEDEAEAAARRLALSEAELQGRIDYVNETTGLHIKNFQELKELLDDGTVVVDELTGEYLTLAQAEENRNAQIERQIELEEKRQESFQQLLDRNKGIEEQYGKVSIEAINAKYAQDLLSQAMKEAKNPIDNLKEAVDKATDAYADELAKLGRLTEGTREYKDQLEKVNKLKGEMVSTNKEYQQALYDQEKKRLADEEQAEKNSYERRKIELEKQLQQGIISREDYAFRITQAEEKLQVKLIELKQAGMEAAKKFLGEESDEYKRQTQQKIDAELELQRVKNDKLETLDDLTNTSSGTSSSGNGTSGGSNSSSGTSFTQDEKSIMQDVINGVYRKAERVGTETQQEANDRYQALRESVEQKLQQQKDAADTAEKNRRSGLAGGFYGNWDSITNTVNDMTSIGQLRNWYADNRKNLLQQSLSMSAFTRELSKHAQNVYRQRVSDLLQKTKDKESTSSESSSGSGKSSSKSITLKLKTDKGQSVQLQTGSGDVSKLLSILEQAGLTTA